MAATATMRLCDRRRRVCRVAAGALGLQAVQIGLPEFIVMQPEVVEHVPGIETTIVAVGKNRLDRIVADRIDTFDGNIPFADLQGFLARSMAACLGRG